MIEEIKKEIEELNQTQFYGNDKIGFKDAIFKVLDKYNTQKPIEIPNCDRCRNKKTMNCPNSSECYEIKNRPFFKEKRY